MRRALGSLGLIVVLSMCVDADADASDAKAKPATKTASAAKPTVAPTTPPKPAPKVVEAQRPAAKPPAPKPASPTPPPPAAPAAPPAEAGAPPAPKLAFEDLRATLGTLQKLGSGRARADAAKMRLVAPTAEGSAELAFRYVGPSAATSTLASGAIRRQVGLKLRAQDGCNLIYAMWRIEPVAELVISVKHNPGKHVHAECGANGYTNVRPTTSAPLPPLTPGTSRKLAARLEGNRLRVHADGALVWEGTLPDAALSFNGPVGVRTDNVAIDFDLGATRRAPGLPPFPLHGDGDE